MPATVRRSPALAPTNELTPTRCWVRADAPLVMVSPSWPTRATIKTAPTQQPRWVLGISQKGLCSVLEVSELCLERPPEGGTCRAARDVRGEALVARDDVGVFQDSQHGGHHEIAGREAVPIEVGLVAEGCGKGRQALLHELDGTGAAQL